MKSRGLKVLIVIAAVLAVALPLHALALGNSDPDNDIPGIVMPVSMEVTGTLDGTLLDGGDLDDVVRVSVPSGRWLWALLVPVPDNAATDFDLYAFGHEATSVAGTVPAWAFSETDGTSVEYVRYRAPAANTYYLDAYAFAGAGGYDLTWGIASRTMTLTAPSSAVATYPITAPLSGVARDTDTSAPVAGVLVRVLAKPYGTTRYVQFGTALTSAGGTWTVPVSPSSKTWYRAIAPGGSDHVWLGRPTSFSITPRAALATPTVPARVRPNVAFTVSGRMTPVHTRGTHCVLVRCYRLEKGVWVRKISTWAYAGYNTSRTATLYSAKVTLGTGQWRIRAYHPDDGRHAASWSPIVERTVR